MRLPPTSRGRGALRLVLAALLLLAGTAAARAQTGSLEYAVKATYLYKFAPFVDWPESAFALPTSPLVLCIVGDDPFGAVLDRAVAGQHLAEHPVVVERMATYAPGRVCHILYAMGSDLQPASEVVALARGRAVLTISDAARGSAGKGIIHFVVQENRVRFEIDDRAAAENDLKISSKLLSLATSVRPRP